MIYELTKEEFYRCNRLVREYSAEALAITQGENPGRIFVDNKERPTTGLIWHKSLDIGFDFIGNPFNLDFNQEVVPFIDEYIKPEAKKIGMEWFEGSGRHPDWDFTVKDIFKHKDLKSDEQQVYIIPSIDEVTPLDFKLSEDFRLVDLLTVNKTANFSYLNQSILASWKSIEDFLEKGIGYGIVHNNKIVSFCLSSYVTNEYYVATVETLKDYRGNKLAQIVTEAFVRECVRKGKIPYWDCMEENYPSQAVAKKLGFNKVQTYYVHYFKF